MNENQNKTEEASGRARTPRSKLWWLLGGCAILYVIITIRIAFDMAHVAVVAPTQNANPASAPISKSPAARPSSSVRSLISKIDSVPPDKQLLSTDEDKKKEFEWIHQEAVGCFQKANVFAAAGNWHEAHKLWSASINLMGRDIGAERRSPDDWHFCSVLYGMIAVSLAEQKKYEGALRHLAEAERLGPKIQDNFLVEANICERMGSLAEAQTARKRANECTSKNDFPAWARDNKFLKN